MNRCTTVRGKAGSLCIGSRWLLPALMHLVVASSCIAATGARAADAGASAPGMVALFVDRATILRSSRAGADIHAQADALQEQLAAELAPENAAIAAEITSLQDTAGDLVPSERQRRIVALEARRQAAEKRARDREAAIQNGLRAARARLEQALMPILQSVLAERGANVLLDRGLALLVSAELDVTQRVVQRLDVALPTLSVVPIPD